MRSLLDASRFVATLLTAVAMSAGFAHLLALPNKIHLRPDDYLVAQSVYRGWALLGIAIVGALVTLLVVTTLVWRRPRERRLTLVAAGALGAGLVVFFAVTQPANAATRNWTMLPSDWETLRRRWEWSHAVGALLDLVALGALVLSYLPRTRRRTAVDRVAPGTRPR